MILSLLSVHLAPAFLGASLFAGIVPSPQATPASDPAPVETKFAEVSGWTVVAVSIDGQYLRCAAAPPAALGLAAALEKSSEGWTLLVPSTASGEEVKGRVEVDGKGAKAVFYRLDDARMGTFLRDGQLKALRTGKTLTAIIGPEQVKLPLEGVPAVLTALGACDKKSGA